MSHELRTTVSTATFCLVSRESDGTVLKSGSMQNAAVNLATATQITVTSVTTGLGRTIYAGDLPDLDDGIYTIDFFETGITPTLTAGALNNIASEEITVAGGVVVSSSIDEETINAMIAAYLVGKSGLSVVNPVTLNQTLLLVRGNDYSTGGAGPLSFTVKQWGDRALPDSAALALGLIDTTDGNVGGLITSSIRTFTATATLSDTTLVITAEIGSVDSVLLDMTAPPANPYNYGYEVQLTTSGKIYSPLLGAATVKDSMFAS